MSQNSYVAFLKTFSQVDIAMIKSLLDGNIDYYFKDENFMSIRQLLEPAILMVRESDFQETQEMLSDFELNFMGVSLKGSDDKKDDCEEE